MKKKLVSAILIASMLFSQIGGISAAQPEQNLVQPDSSEFILESSVDSARNFTDASDYQEDLVSEVGVNSSDIRIETIGNIVSVSMDITEGDLTVGIKSQGEIFSIHGDGYYDDKLILGRFEPTNNYDIVLFKILNEGTMPQLSLLIENIATDELTEYAFEINQDKFDNLMKIAKSTTESNENAKDPDGDISPQRLVAQEVIALMQPKKNYSSLGNRNILRALNSSSFKSTSTNTGSAANATEGKTFCTNVSAPTASNGITPSSTMQTVLSQTGWKMHKTDTYFYVMHGVANTSTEQLVTISVASVSQSNASNTRSITAIFEIIGSCTVSYNKNTKIAKLLLSNSGIKMEDATVAIELVGGTTNFDTSMRSYGLENNTNAVKNVMVAISKNLGIASAIWNALQTTSISSDNKPFGTDDNQINVYGGLVRAVANQTSSSKSLWGKGCYLGINGVYNPSPKTFSSYRVAYGFTGYSLL